MRISHPPSGHLYCKKAEDKDSARMDSLAICSGEDKRLVVVPSFASVGIKHTWLLLKARSQLARVAGVERRVSPKLGLSVVAVLYIDSIENFLFWMFHIWKSDFPNTDIFCQQNTVETNNQISH